MVPARTRRWPIKTTRREFIKRLGVALASLVAVRCTVGKKAVPTIEISCYEVAAPTVEPTPTADLLRQTAVLSDVIQGGDIDPDTTRHAQAALGRERLRACWLALEQLADLAAKDGEQGERKKEALVAEHRAALDELVAVGELAAAVAEQVQVAYAEAAFHVWAQSMPLVCYEPVEFQYQPASSDQLARQAVLLAEMAERSDLDPAAVAQVRAAIERDISFLNLSDQALAALYAELRATPDRLYPPLDELDLEVTPESAQAARYLVGLLLGERG